MTRNCIILPAVLLMFAAGCKQKPTVPVSDESDMYKTYVVQKVVGPIEIDADWDKPIWQGIEPLTIDLYMGDKPDHLPKTQAKLAWDDDYIYVIFRVEDRYVRAVATEYFGNVCQDSCVEFFFTPQEDVAEGYFNLETNCIGTILMFHLQAIDKGRRYLNTQDLDKIRLATSFHKGKVIDPEITEPMFWTLEYALPWRMLENYAPVIPPAPGVKRRANFYKCADKTSHPHWLTWSKIPLDRPNFHQPQYFGYIEFTDERD